MPFSLINFVICTGSGTGLTGALARLSASLPPRLLPVGEKC
jgi:hypothetical protein